MIRTCNTLARVHLLMWCFGFCTAFIVPAHAQSTHLVTTTMDDGAGSLRQAIEEADNNDIISFDDAIHGQTIELTSGALVIDKNIVISGPGVDLMSVNAMGLFRVIEIGPDIDVEVEAIALIGGEVVGNGGGLFVGERASLTLLSVLLFANEATDNGGGLYVSPGASVSIHFSEIAGNKSSGDLSPNGGGIYNASGNVSVVDSIIRENESTRGGGVWNTSNATMNIDSSWITGNRANLEGGGIYNNSKLTLTRSTVSGNEADVEAGGIRNRSGDTLKVINSTVAGNSAPGTGGIVNFQGSTTLIYNSTIYGNTSDTPGAGIWNAENASVVLYSSIVAANIRDASVHSDILDDAAGVVSQGYNWIGARTTFQALPTDKVGTTESPINPRLMPLSLNDQGGPTHNPEEVSLIVDQGDCQRLALQFDQRGAARVIDVPGVANTGDGCDIGAVEFNTVNVSIEENFDKLPESLSISSAYPNPSFSKSIFNVTLPRDEHVTITLYNILGKQVQVLHTGPLTSRAAHVIEIDATTLPAGMYIYKVEGESFMESRPIVVIK